ncbi:MAG: ABC-F family ATP-binding cassette domain-containing protein [Alphaproteobacteria bacterium]
MLHINDLTYRIEGRLILDRATAAIPAGHKVGLVGRNGAGKSTLLKLIQGEIGPEGGTIGLPRNARMGSVAQEAPGTEDSLIDTVLAADKERASLLAEAETATDPHRIAEIQTRLADIDAHSAPARAAAILSGLGFDEAAQQRPCSAFSGGWRMRVALAAVLFSAPDLLLLDEPTNYLDLEGVIWLETYLRSYPYTVLLVSHDRDLLNRAVGSILHLEHQRLTLYAGTYDQFEAQRRARFEQQLAMKKKQEAHRRHIESFVERFRAKASKARQAQSRLKILEKMQPIATMVEDRLPPFTFPDPEPLSPPIITMEEAGVGYEPDTPILKRLTLRIDNDDRIALLGANGNGKSTFAKLIAGRLKISMGRLRRSPTLGIGYFAQHQLDELNPRESPYELYERLLPDATEAQRRAKLGALGFTGPKADTKIGDLSGGEKARIMLALATWSKPHLLILDEPTNHLDVDSREALIHALNTYQGAVILISHDRHLVEACADRLWLVNDGTVMPYEDDLDTYRQWLLARANGKTAKKDPDKDGTDSVKSARTDERRASATRRAQLAPLKREAEKWEKLVADLTAKREKARAKLADPKIYTDHPDKAADLARIEGQLEKKITEAEEKWIEALEAYEGAQ